jgi:hypothetical protein
VEGIVGSLTANPCMCVKWTDVDIVDIDGLVGANLYVCPDVEMEEARGTLHLSQPKPFVKFV